jgi:hypothetical protein
MFKPMMTSMKKFTNQFQLETAEIVIEKWRDTDWARGAACLVLQEIYKSPLNRVRPALSHPIELVEP